ncbi:methyltransferase domain-containing protein [Celerinatantimonas sp. YJH-8]|uniref:methyltransferase domain-containing protein n=1 Tax=Celerinatantimonas sp. YJH-8 TaxID=3228714 RepID=UPI0038C22D21
MTDQNFDQLSHKFNRNIYGTIKGKIRAAVLMNDLRQYTPITTQRLRILDAGGGFGFISQQLAAQGHEVVLCDVSKTLLDQAQHAIDHHPSPLPIQLLHCAIQDLPKALGQFDLILCHAVLEWLEDGFDTLTHLKSFLRQNGRLSLMFYNQEAQRFHALVCGNFSYIRNGLKAKKTVRLTPSHSYLLKEIQQWFQHWQLNVLHTSGVRVINDYLKAGAREQFDDNQLIEMELKYADHPAYIELGRYIHIIGQYK